MEEERLFVVEKLAYRPRVTFMVLLLCCVSWRTNTNISRLAEEMVLDDIRPEREPFGFGSAVGAFLKYLYRAILCTGHMYIITWRWNHFRWKLLSQMKANSWNLRIIRPVKYKHFIVWVICYAKKPHTAIMYYRSLRSNRPPSGALKGRKLMGGGGIHGILPN